MIPVSAAYKAAVSADVRRFVPRVLFYFDGDAAPPVEFGEEQVSFLNLLEEANAEGSNPIGSVSANELTVGLDNSQRLFTPTNEASPYYGKLRPNILVRAYLGLEIGADVEWVPLGAFRTGDWSAPPGSVEATVTCYDRLWELGNKDMPTMRAVQDTTIGAMFEALLKELGLGAADYEIDPSLTQPVKLGWFPKGKVKDALQALAVAGFCSVNADRYGRIRVRNRLAHGAAAAALTDQDQIIGAENPQKVLDAYNAVSVQVAVPYIKPPEEILRIDALEVPNGEIVLDSMEFPAPVAEVEKVSLLGAVSAKVEKVEYGTWGMSIAISNPGAAEKVGLSVLGRQIDMIRPVVQVEDAALVAAWGRKALEVESYLIQDQQVAKTYAASLLQLYKDPFARFSLEIRGDPALEAGDVVSVVDPADRIAGTDVELSRIKLDYDGALSASVEGMKPVAIWDWAFVSPGLYVYAARKFLEVQESWTYVTPGLPALVKL